MTHLAQELGNTASGEPKGLAKETGAVKMEGAVASHQKLTTAN